MEINGQFHDLAALSPGREENIPKCMCRRVLCSTAGLDVLVNRIIFRFCWKSKHTSSVTQSLVYSLI
jgi:hypothetical protein